MRTEPFAAAARSIRTIPDLLPSCRREEAAIQVRGITWWLLVGMFGWGAFLGFLISVWVGTRLTTFRQGEAVWWEPLWRGLLALAGVVVIPLLAGDVF